jgi:hypothetical protein
MYASRNLVTTARMAFQGIFLMAAFTASMKLKPRLNPKHEDAAHYNPVHGGVNIVARCDPYLAKFGEPPSFILPLEIFRILIPEVQNPL